MSEVLVLRTCAADGSSYNGFKWPLEVGAEVSAPDWDPKPQCGHGLHGALHGEGVGALFNWAIDAVWMVVAVESDWIVDLHGKVKFPACVIRFVGSRKNATDYIMEHDPLARCVIGATVTGGYRATVTGGDHATVTGGHRATITGGDHATVTGGDCSTITGGAYSTITGGAYSTITGGDRSTVTGGYGATVTGGDCSTVTGGDCSTITGGAYSTVTGGDRSTVTGGDCSTITGGAYSTITGGDRSTVTGGYGATVTGGDCAILQIKRWDENRIRIVTGYVGENGIKPNVAYRCDNTGRLVLA